MTAVTLICVIYLLCAKNGRVDLILFVALVLSLGIGGLVKAHFGLCPEHYSPFTYKRGALSDHTNVGIAIYGTLGVIIAQRVSIMFRWMILGLLILFATLIAIWSFEIHHRTIEETVLSLPLGIAVALFSMYLLRYAGTSTFRMRSLFLTFFVASFLFYQSFLEGASFTRYIAGYIACEYTPG